eukprot:scaffold10114_cov38-Cyclotella_meneghiniana.AAC.3
MAVILRIAEGMPSGRSFVLSSGSFSNATRCFAFVEFGEDRDEIVEGGWVKVVKNVDVVLVYLSDGCVFCMSIGEKEGQNANTST